MCAIVMVATPRSNCHPNICWSNCSSDTNSNSMDRPVMTSGMTSGAVVRPCSSARPRNGPKRDRTRPASVPRITAPVADIAATWMDSHAAERMAVSSNSLAYHLRVGEFAASHTVTRRELLNEKKIIERIGTYRKKKPNPNIVLLNRPWVFMPARSFLCGLQFFVLEALENHDRHDKQQQHRDGHGTRLRPVTIEEEFVGQQFRHHELVGAAEQRRNDVLTHRRD